MENERTPPERLLAFKAHGVTCPRCKWIMGHLGSWEHHRTVYCPNGNCPLYGIPYRYPYQTILLTRVHEEEGEGDATERG